MTRKPRIGTYVKIPLPNGKNAYARLIGNYLFSFFCPKDLPPGIDGIESFFENLKPVFSTHVHKTVFSKNKWEVIGFAPLEDHLLKNMPVFFRQDISDKDKCYLITVQPGFKKAVKPEDCIKLEREAVWDFDHIETRLTDYFENRPNPESERLKVKL